MQVQFEVEDPTPLGIEMSPHFRTGQGPTQPCLRVGHVIYFIDFRNNVELEHYLYCHYDYYILEIFFTILRGLEFAIPRHGQERQ
jgi:hypothetical protein